MYLREVTHKGDPMIRIRLPGSVMEMLRRAAKLNKRRVQDQLMKSLSETLRNERGYRSRFEALILEVKEMYGV
jgi:hypothetical protein